MRRVRHNRPRSIQNKTPRCPKIPPTRNTGGWPTTERAENRSALRPGRGDGVPLWRSSVLFGVVLELNGAPEVGAAIADFCRQRLGATNGNRSSRRSPLQKALGNCSILEGLVILDCRLALRVSNLSNGLELAVGCRECHRQDCNSGSMPIIVLMRHWCRVVGGPGNLHVGEGWIDIWGVGDWWPGHRRVPPTRAGLVGRRSLAASARRPRGCPSCRMRSPRWRWVQESARQIPRCNARVLCDVESPSQRN